MDNRKYNRRNFLKISGLTTMGSLLTHRLPTNNKHIYSVLNQGTIPADTPQNRIAEIVETKLVSKESGKYLIIGQSIDENGHPKATQPFIEPNRCLGWPSITKTDKGELLIVYSGDRDSHVCPWGKTRLIRSTNNGKTWSEPETVINSPLDDQETYSINRKIRVNRLQSSHHTGN